MKWDDFLTDIADRYALSGTQRQWFLMRFSEEHLKKDDREFEVFLADLEMQDPVKTSRKQMGGVYQALDKSLRKIAKETASNKSDNITAQ